MAFLKSSDEILSVGEFSRRFKNLVKVGIPELWLRGEISNLKNYASGHTYFTLKDGDAALSAVLFKGNSRGVSFPLREGMKILAFGEIGIYEARGSYQLMVKAALQDGTGELSKKFEELKKKLSDEGLFDKSRKREIPKIPRNVGVVTSANGAAIADFCRILRRRNWGGNVWIFPSRVQGEEAADEIVSQIGNARNFLSDKGDKIDLLIVMRGGGSLEDLWPFNEERVARALAESPIPTISAVGHEIDFSLSDFVADMRAETPSAAAEWISSARIEILARIDELESSISKETEYRLDSLRNKLKSAADILRINSPLSKIANYSIMLDEAQGRLDSIYRDRLDAFKSRLHLADSLFSRLHPSAKMALLSQRLDGLSKQLWLLGAESALRRGYALLADSEGNLVSSVSSLSAGDTFSARLLDGRIFARAEEIKPDAAKKNSNRIL